MNPKTSGEWEKRRSNQPANTTLIGKTIRRGLRAHLSDFAKGRVPAATLSKLDALYLLACLEADGAVKALYSYSLVANAREPGVAQMRLLDQKDAKSSRATKFLEKLRKLDEKTSKDWRERKRRITKFLHARKQPSRP